jgi:hypothetical protein
MRFMRAILLTIAMTVLAVSAQARPLEQPALETWLESYGAAWLARDAAAAGRLFTTDASYHENAFEAPMRGRAAIEAYWARVTADQTEIKYESTPIAVSGHTGIAHWKASFKLKSNGAIIELDGVFVLEFDEKGACKSLREWWFVKPS